MMDDYLFYANSGQPTNIIMHRGKGVKKRKGVKFPMADMHSKPIIFFEEKELLIYEQYGIWYLKTWKT